MPDGIANHVGFVPGWNEDGDWSVELLIAKRGSIDHGCFSFASRFQPKPNGVHQNIIEGTN